MQRISKHISYKEATHSNTAIRRGIKNDPMPEQLANMMILAEKVFEPLRNHFNEPIRINSFFRSVTLNNRIGGAKSSQHTKGEAIDISAMNGITNKQLFDYIKDNLEFDQLINEYPDSKGNPSWVHVSYTMDKPNRNKILIAKRVNGRTVYELFR